tara:strand:- start:16156 stop:16998 length:843 start_codon:yes stop_codon:yes gene_type:complete
MKHSVGRFTGAGGGSIYFQYWEPEAAPGAVILLAHGAGEHSARYQRLAQFFAGHNYVVAALDHTGHGYSEGVPGHVGSFEDYLHDLAKFHRQTTTRFADAPLIFVGHSMGALIGCNYLLRHQDDFVGAVLSGPAIKTDLEPGFIQMAFLRLLALLAPRLGMLKLDAEGVSRDPTVVTDYIADPLVFHGKMSARMLRELFAGMDTIQADAASITLPMLILHGGADSMAAPEGSRFLYEHIGSNDKTLKIYPGLYHEIFNEPEQAEVLDTVLSWCESRLAAM